MCLEYLAARTLPSDAVIATFDHRDPSTRSRSTHSDKAIRDMGGGKPANQPRDPPHVPFDVSFHVDCFVPPDSPRCLPLSTPPLQTSPNFHFKASPCFPNANENLA